jgi:hypothetical protein
LMKLSAVSRKDRYKGEAESPAVLLFIVAMVIEIPRKGRKLAKRYLNE